MTNNGQSLKVDRIRRILDLVNSRNRISLSELEEKVDASRITIQRDLVDLEKRRLLKRFHGGAMSLEYSENLYDRHDHLVRRSLNVDVKRKIAAKAVTLIKPNMYIAMDASSTVYYMSECEFPSNVFVLTCGIDTFTNLSQNPNLQLILAGGQLNRKTNTLAGPEAVEVIHKYRFDMAFVSAESYVPGGFFFDPYADEVMVKQALINGATETTMLLDSGKIAASGGIKLCGKHDTHHLVTDAPNHKELKKDFKDRIL